jgi:hypothetical protein
MNEQEMSAEIVAEETIVESVTEEATNETEAEQVVAEEVVTEDPAVEVAEMTEPEQHEEHVEAEELSSETETAAVHVETRHTEIDEVFAFDTETGESISVRDTHEEMTHAMVEEGSDKAPVAAEEIVEAEEQQPEETAENKAIAELRSMIEALQHEIAELKKVEVVTASEKEADEVVSNPFMAEITTEGSYRLLERAPKSTSYSLLERA